MPRKIFPLFLLLLCGLSVQSQSLIKENLQVVGSIQDKEIKLLSKQEFLSFRTNNEKKGVGVWLALITDLKGANPQVHIINPTFFSSIEKTNIRPKYGVHETYARYHNYANGSMNYIQKVQKGDGQLIPLELMITMGPGDISEALNIKWVVQNRRYKYLNSSAQFADLLEQAEILIRKKLLLTDIKGAFVDYHKYNTFQRPNSKTSTGRKDIEHLKAKGYTTISIKELNRLLSMEDTSKLQIVNNGTLDSNTNLYETYGILRYVNDYSDTATGVNSFRALTYNDIPIFSELPLSILPVAGIFVLEPQTELSHVNILARNRGTLNVSINTDSKNWEEQQLILQKELDGYSPSLLNKPVRISHKGGGRIRMVAISKEELVKQLNAQRAKQVHIVLTKPKQPTQNKWILKPSAQALGVDYVGAKAANYGKIEKLLGHEWVLPGYAIGFELYLETIKKKGPHGRPQDLIETFLKEKDTLSNFQIAERLARIRSAIYAIPYDSIPRHTFDSLTVADELEALLRLDENIFRKAYFEPEAGQVKLDTTLRSLSKYTRTNLFENFNYKNVGRLRFRSSTNCEDLPQFNGAGLYQSKGCTLMRYGKRYIDKRLVWEKLKTVLASLWLDKAYYERAYFKVEHKNAAMAIQINPAFSGYWLGMPRLAEWANGVVTYQENNGVPLYHINSQIGTAAVTNPLDGELSESFEISEDNISVKALSYVKGQTNYIFVQPNGQLVSKEKELHKILEELKGTIKIIYNQLVLQNGHKEYSNPENYAIDIEYKIMWNPNTKVKKLFIKQARPLRLR